MNQSEDIKELMTALAKAQSMMKPAVFNRVNPHFKSRYADFSSCMEACRGPLSENGIATIQYCQTINDKLNLVTMLAHTSGQWMKSEFPLISSKMDSQGIGSAMTYAKRYSLCGMVGIVADEDLSNDDDGETAVGRGKNVEHTRIPPRPQPSHNSDFEKTKKAAESLDKKPEKVTAPQLHVLKNLESKLDSECKKKIYAWMKSSYDIESLEQVLSENFKKVFGALENAIKFMEQSKLEGANV